MGAPHAAVGRRLRLAGHFAEPVVVELVDDYGDVVTLRVRTARGQPKDTTISAAELQEALKTAEAVAVGAFDVPRRPVTGTITVGGPDPTRDPGALAAQANFIHAPTRVASRAPTRCGAPGD